MNEKTRNKLIIVAITLAIIFTISMGIIDTTEALSPVAGNLVRGIVIALAVFISAIIILVFLWYWISEIIWDDVKRKYHKRKY